MQYNTDMFCVDVQSFIYIPTSLVKVIMIRYICFILLVPLQFFASVTSKQHRKPDWKPVSSTRIQVNLAKPVCCLECEQFSQQLNEKVEQLEKKIGTMNEIHESVQFFGSAAAAVQGAS